MAGCEDQSVYGVQTPSVTLQATILPDERCPGRGAYVCSGNIAAAAANRGTYACNSTCLPSSKIDWSYRGACVRSDTGLYHW